MKVTLIDNGPNELIPKTKPAGSETERLIENYYNPERLLLKLAENLATGISGTVKY